MSSKITFNGRIFYYFVPSSDQVLRKSVNTVRSDKENIYLFVNIHSECFEFGSNKIPIPAVQR